MTSLRSNAWSLCFAMLLAPGWIANANALDHLATGRTHDPEVSVEKRYPDSAGGFEIWLVNAKEQSEKRLYRTPRNAGVLFSTGMEWLVVNDAEGSGTTSCKLFKRVGASGSVDYKLAKDLTVPAWSFFAAQTQRNPEGLHHDYVRARCWLEDPQAIVLSLIGHGDPGHFRVRYWTCVYRVDEGAFSVDLKAVNQERVVESTRE